MTLETITILAAAISGVFAAIVTAIVTLFVGWRQFPLRKMEASAEAEHDNASAALTRKQAEDQQISNYERLMEMLRTRDGEISRINQQTIELQTKYIELESKLRIVENQYQAERSMREQERRLRQEYFHDLQQEREMRHAIEEQYNREKREWQATAVRLQSEIDSLKTKIEEMQNGSRDDYRDTNVHGGDSPAGAATTGADHRNADRPDSESNERSSETEAQ